MPLLRKAWPEYGARGVLKHIPKLRRGELASKNLQEEVDTLHEAPAFLENSGVGGGRRANGAAEQVMQGLGERARVLMVGIRLKDS